jgi:hypothetical protein
MNIKEQQVSFNEFVELMENTLIKKGNDYANEDRLSNFKLAGSVCGLSAEQNCLSLIATKVARLGVLLKTNKPNNESIQDSVLDLACYATLLYMIIDEKSKTQGIQ